MARPRKFDEQEAVAAARRQFNETGYHGTSVDELSRVTGLSKGSLYGAFGDKDKLFRRIFEEYCTQSDEGAAARVEGPEEEALERLRAWLTAPEGDLDRRGCLLAKTTAELAWEDEAIAARSLAAYETLLESCTQLIEQAQRAGLVDPAAQPEVLGALILATHRGLEALLKAGVGRETLTGIANAAIDNITLPVRGASARASL